jgi:hypothetical protein
VTTDPEQPELAERDDLAERDRATVLACEHEAIELHQSTLKYLHGPAYVDVITCVTCPTEIVLVRVSDARDDLDVHRPLGN